MPNKNPRRLRLIRAIHAAARGRGMDDATRKMLQMEIVGKKSCSEMTADELGRVLDRLNTHPARIAALDSDGDDQAQLRAKINAQLCELQLSTAYADGIARRMFNRPLCDCNGAELGKVIAALWYHGRRQAS